ncbi:A-kinase anchor protein 5 [Xenopus laevis]|uniref:A kinase-anchoring proteins AKAP-5 and AKAP-12 calmodulin (CaM)-binding domain-containing protein n=2 Tax=Xenopus laevis TaxID=8355 RepID=A0A974C870_XENLA|nr:A-kinase anchor protein 5 [Xenopus laevis]OCT68470.1 hypothetical protein XELAEV_18039771mg [Xenopus laevis]
MSECKGDSSGATREETERGNLPPSLDLMEKTERSTKSSKGYSGMFLRKGKEKKNDHNLSKDLKVHEKKSVNSSVTKKCEGLCFEEASNEFTCSSSIMESYQLSTNKEARYCFRKLDDGTYAMEKIEESNPGKNESIPRKKSSKRCQQKGRYSHKPLKICFKKRSKAIRKTSDSIDDYTSENKKLHYTNQYEGQTSVSEIQNESTQDGKTWATFKRLVTHKKKRHSSLKQQSQINHETNSNNTCIRSVSKKKRFSNLKISCMNFSRGKKHATGSMPPQDYAVESQESENRYDCKRSDNPLAIKYQLQRSLDVENGKTDRNIDQCVYMPSDEFQSLPKLKRVMNHLTQGTNKRNLHKSLRKPNVESVRSPSLEEREAPCLSAIEKEGMKAIINTRLPQSPVREQDLLCCTIKCSENTANVQKSGKAELNDLKMSHSYAPQHMAATLQSGNMHESYKNNLNDCEVSSEDDARSSSLLISDPYETLLITTSASLVKKVLQASIQQLVDEESPFQ